MRAVIHILLVILQRFKTQNQFRVSARGRYVYINNKL